MGVCDKEIEETEKLMKLFESENTVGADPHKAPAFCTEKKKDSWERPIYKYQLVQANFEGWVKGRESILCKLKEIVN